MIRVIELIISFLIVITVFVVIALFLPSSRTITHTVETNRPMTTVNDLLTSFVRFKDWTPMLRYDPRMSITASGPESGVGARLDYDSSVKAIGKGSWEIVEFIPEEKIVIKVENKHRGSDKSITFRFKRTGQRNQNVKISQRYKVNYGWDLIGRYAGMYVTRNVGDDVRRGLDKLSNLLTTIPRFDYSRHPAEFTFVDLPPINALVASTAAKRANDDIAVAMSNQLKWIEQVMEKNALESAGPMRIVTNEFTNESYGFDVVMPVRKKGSAEAGTAEPAADGSVAESAAIDPSAPLETLEVKIEGDNNPVLFAQLPAMRAAQTTYMGPSPGLPRVRDLVKAWAMVRGAEPADRPFEQYRVAIAQMLAEDAEYQVYWPIKTGNEPAAAAPAVEAPAVEAPAVEAPAIEAPATEVPAESEAVTQ